MKYFALFVCVLYSLSLTPSAVNNLRPEYKTWWAKQITYDLYTAGRLTETQYKYAGEAGFKTIISMFNYSSDITIGGELLPGASKAQNIVENLVGIDFAIVLQPSESPIKLATVHRLSELMATATPPVLFHCTDARAATFFALNHLASKSRNDPDFVPKMDSRALYERGVTLGYDFSDGTLKQIVADVTGEAVVASPPKPDVTLPNWNNIYWPIRPIYKNWYIAGLVQAGHLANFSNYIDTVINTRKGVTTPPDNKPSQGEVTLLNIREGTGEGRQTEARLLETRLDPGKPNSYISDTSEKNYEASNPQQFGDHIGYNEMLEKQAMADANLKYVHTPIGGQYGRTVEMFEHYKDTWMEAGKLNAVLVHCRSGRRASVAALLAAGHQYGKNSTWALQHAQDLGYHFEEDGADDVVKLFRDVLDSSGEMTRQNWSVIIAIAVWVVYRTY